ncbi:rho gtpase-activating protein 68f [Anaeramoeba flamelloides]|uniref:Rho gtpase-activating protein 68f n=1 Tax=Anaeramoeba flamelloides TaxID=1746091 RepID=A0ABQ8Z0G1_9EUKA|nr:rho gtpase-activating protein 68f [Anaeramoeba flamelloides]
MTQVFGVQIIENGKVPEVVLDIITQLEKLHAEESLGIFRIGGNLRVVHETMERYNKGEKNVAKGINDVNTLSTLLKYYLMELPESLTTIALYDSFIEVLNLRSKEKKIEHLYNLIHNRLPSTRKLILQRIIKHLSFVSTRSKLNLMTVDNFGVVFGINFFRPNTKDPKIILQTSNKSNKVTSFLIENYDQIFENHSNLNENVSADLQDEKEFQKNN